MFKKAGKLSPKTITHKFDGTEENNRIVINGSYDVNIWYSYDNDTKTTVITKPITYKEIVSINLKNKADTEVKDIIVRSLKQPTCTKVDIVNGTISYDIEKELGIEIVGDAKVRIAVDEEEDEWDEIIDEKEEEDLMNEIDTNVNENFINETDNNE